MPPSTAGPLRFCRACYSSWRWVPGVLTTEEPSFDCPNCGSLENVIIKRKWPSVLSEMPNADLTRLHGLILQLMRNDRNLRTILAIGPRKDGDLEQSLERVRAEMAKRRLPIEEPVLS
jgi:predicted RNA-binding Zn-ribbon protein involved in translation (DUF1610 family)